MAWDGSRLRAVREQHEMTQQELADLLRVKQQRVTEWERGRRVPRYLTRVAICALVGEQDLHRLEALSFDAPPDTETDPEF